MTSKVEQLAQEQFNTFKNRLCEILSEIEEEYKSAFMHGYAKGETDEKFRAKQGVPSIIADLEQKLEQAEKDLSDYQFNYPTIKELQKENAELKEKLEGAEKARDYWKDSSFDWRHKCTSRKPFKVAVKAQEQLTKAKEIIKKLYPHVFQGMDFMELNDYNVQKAEVEQFLKEQEND